MHPLDVTIDDEVQAGYVRYAKTEVAETVEVWDHGTVAADLDSAGNVIGIELLGFAKEILSHARAFAREHDLVFPSL
jgi:uncharacterized protein YuzE